MAGEDVTLENLRQLLHIQSELRQQAETRWKTAQQKLVSLLERYAGEEVDRRMKAGQMLDSLPVDDLVGLIQQVIGAKIALLPAANPSKNGNGIGLEEDLKKKQDEVRALQAENQRLELRQAELTAEIERLKTQLSALQQVSNAQVAALKKTIEDTAHPNEPEQPFTQEPDWMARWRETETFERDASILKILGETGLARRPEIEEKAAEALGIKKAGGSIQALFARLTNHGLIEIFRPWKKEGTGVSGRSPDLLRLTDLGRLAFWLLTGREATPSEYDLLLKRHVSPEHTLLNLEAADLLQTAGYRVNLHAPDILLPDGGSFRPDLVLTGLDGEVLYVEVEREANKDPVQRQAKWRNYNQASGGVLYVVCDNRTCMRQVRSEINYTLGKEPAAIHLTNISDYRIGKRGPGKSIWLDRRERRDDL